MPVDPNDRIAPLKVPGPHSPHPPMRRRLSPQRHPPQVALLVETSLASGRDILRGIARYLHEHTAWSLYHEPRSLEDGPPNGFSQWRGDGIIARIQTPALARAIAATRLPAVDVLGLVPDTGLPLVRVDDRAIAIQAANHLLERGFRHFGFLGITGENWSSRRRDAFLAHLGHQGLSTAEIHIPRHTPRGSSWERQQEAVARWIRNLQKPSGIMVCSDQRGPQLLDACRRASVNVPDEVAVIGVDNDEPLCEVCNPPLSSVWPGHHQAGYEAARLLDSLMQGGQAPGQPILVNPKQVVTRRSTEVLAVDDRVVAAALRIAREHASERIRVQEIAHQAGVSRSVLQRRFRAALGHTVHDELVKQRLHRAQQLLQSSSLSLADIAERAGFVHQEYMGAVFKEVLGITPAGFRRQTPR